VRTIRLKVLLFATLGVLGPLGVGLARADSDGYYCVGDGYIAYQFGMDVPNNPPRLYVITLNGTRGIPKPATIAFPPFQVQGMRCGSRSIDVAAYDKMYVVSLDERRQPRRYSERPLASIEPIPFQTYGNLSMLMPARADMQRHRIRLGAASDGGEYALEMSATLVRPSDPCEAAGTSRLVRTDRTGRAVSALTIFAGRVGRECGD
jgi:hypothetical protein